MTTNNFNATIDGVTYTFDELKTMAISSNPEMIKVAVSSGDDTLCRIVATNSRSTPELLNMLAGYNKKVAIGVTRNKSAPFEAWRKLSVHEEKSIRLAVAASKRTPSQILEEMVKVETEKRILAKIVENPNTGHTAIRILATSGDPVKQNLVSNSPKLDMEVLFSLIQNPNVLHSAAYNDTVPVFILERLGETFAGTNKIQFLSTIVTALAQREEFWDWPEEWFEAQYGIGVPYWVSNRIADKRAKRDKDTIESMNYR